MLNIVNFTKISSNFQILYRKNYVQILNEHK